MQSTATSSERPTLRTATLADVPELTQLIARSVTELSKGLYTPEQIEESLRTVFGVDTQLVYDETYYVVECDGEIAGCGGWSKRRTLYGGDQHKGNPHAESDDLLDPATEAARIRAFFVDPRWARRGIGSMLMNACEDAAQRCGFHIFEMASTLPGIPLYTRFGYEPLERFEVRMPSGLGLPVVRMRKAIY